MTISRNTFDPTNNYKRVHFHEDRDLLDSEVNELQEIGLHDRQLLLNVANLIPHLRLRKPERCTFGTG